MRLPFRNRGISLPPLELPHLWAIGALAGIFVTLALNTIAVNDFWWHLRVGEIILTSRQIPAVDSFSFVAQGTPYVYGQWLAEVYYYALFRMGGLELVVLMHALLLTATAGLVLLAAWETSRNLRIAAICTVAGMVIALANRDVRPQTLGFLCFALFSLVLTRCRRGKTGGLWLLPVVAVFWSNVHGSAILGVALCLLVLLAELCNSALGLWPTHLAGKQLAKLGAVTAAIGAALFVNPYGMGIIQYVVAIQRNSVIQTRVVEWFAPSLRNPEDLPLFAMLFACVVLLAIGPKREHLTDTIVLIAFSVMALQAARNSAWFGIIAAPFLARQTASIWRQWLSSSKRSPALASPLAAIAGASGPTRTARTLNSSFAVLLIAVAALSLPWVKVHLPWPDKVRGLVDEQTPVAAVDYIATHFPRERFFHSDGFGSYMEWATPGAPQVFVDGRVELYPATVWQDYLQISMAQGWEDRLDSYGISHVLLAKNTYKGFQHDLRAALGRSPSWRKLYDDQSAEVYAKLEPSVTATQ